MTNPDKKKGQVTFRIDRRRVQGIKHPTRIISETEISVFGRSEDGRRAQVVRNLK